MNLSTHRWRAAFLPGFFFGHISRATGMFPKALPVSVLLVMFTALFLPASVQGQGRDLVGGNLVQFDDNGIWTWYSDEWAETSLIDGKIAFRERSGGNTDAPNWPTFLKFADRYIKVVSVPPKSK
jgi:hypothetical protein